MHFETCMRAPSARAMFLQNQQYFKSFISMFDKSDSNSSLPCPETFKHKTFLKPCVLTGFWHPPSRNRLFYNVFAILLLQVHRCYVGARPIIITSIGLRIDFVQTLRRLYIASFGQLIIQSITHLTIQ